MAIAFRGATSFDNGTSISAGFSLTAPTGTIASDVGIIHVSWVPGATTDTVTYTGPGTGTVLKTVYASANLIQATFSVTGVVDGNTLSFAMNTGRYLTAGASFYSGATVGVIGATGDRGGVSSANLVLPGYTSSATTSWVVVTAGERTTATGTTVTGSSPNAINQRVTREGASSATCHVLVADYAPGSTTVPQQTLTYNSASTNAGGSQIELKEAAAQAPVVALTRATLGLPTPTSIRVSTLTTGTVTGVRLAVSTSSNMANPTYSSSVTPDSSGYTGGQSLPLAVTGLIADTVYYWQVEVNGTLTGPISDTRTLKAVGAATSFSFASASCNLTASNATTFDAIRTMTNAASQRAQFFAHLGDIHYFHSASGGNSVTEANDPAEVRTHYEASLQTTRASALYRTVPLTHTFSDNDFAGSNSDSTFAARPAVISARRQILADPTFTGSEGIYKTWVIGRVRFIQTDSRSFLGAKGSNGTYLGTEQKAWFKSTIQSMTEPLLVWFCDNNWAGTATNSTALDDWRNYSTERQEIADFLVSTGRNTKMMYVHGDSHSLAADSGANNPFGGFPLYNVGPLHQSASTHPAVDAYDQGKYPASGSATSYQYGWFDIDDTGSNITVTFKGYSVDPSTAATTQQKSYARTYSAPAVTGSSLIRSASAITAGKTLTTLSATLPAAPTAGRLLVSTLAVDKTVTSPVAPSGWTVGGTWTGTAGVGLVWAYKTAAGTETGPVTWTWSNAAGATTWVGEFGLYSPVFASNTTNGTESNVNSLSVTSPSASSAGARIAFAAIDSAGTGVSPASWPDAGPTWTNATQVSTVVGTVVGGSADNGGVSVAIASADAVASTAATISYTYSGAADQQALMVGSFTGTTTAPTAAPTITVDNIPGTLTVMSADSLGQIADGGAVSTWVDKKSRWTLTPATTAPTKVAAGALKSKPAVRFNGTNQNLRMTSAPALLQPYTIGAVVVPATASLTGDHQVVWQGNGGEAAIYQGKWFSYAGAGLTAQTPNPSTNGTVVTWEYNGTTNSSIEVNGAPGVTGNAGTGEMTAGTLFVGDHGTVDRYFAGDIYEIRVWDHALTDAEEATWHSYVQDTYGITVADYQTSTTAQGTRANLPTPARKFRAATITGLADGARVPSWGDTVSGGVALTQATTANQPYYLASGANGKPAVNFNTSGQFLAATTSAVNQPSTLVAVVGGAGGGDEQLIHHGIELLTSGARWVGYAGSGTTASTSYTGTQVVVYTVNNGTATLHVNGNLVASGAEGTTTFTTALRMGSLPNGARQFYQPVYDYHEYNTALTADQRVAVTSEISDFYGITVKDYAAPAAAAAFTGTANFSGDGTPAPTTQTPKFTATSAFSGDGTDTYAPTAQTVTSPAQFSGSGTFTGAAFVPVRQAPNEIPNLASWWRMDNASATSGRITSVVDRAPNAPALVQATAGQQPLLVNVPPAAARFDAQYALTSSASRGGGAQTVFAVATQSDLTGARPLVSSSGGGGFELRLNDGKVMSVLRSQTALAVGGTVTPLGNRVIATGTYQQSAQAVYVNGKLDATATIANAITAANTTQVGNGQSGESFRGDIYEVITYDRVLTAAERASVHSYLSDRYGVTVQDYLAPAPQTAPAGTNGLIYNETFTGANGAAWPAVWVPGTTGAGSSATIQNNRGRLQSGSTGSYSANDRVSRRYTTTATDIDTSFTFIFDGTEALPFYIMRSPSTTMDTADGYYLEINPGTYGLYKATSYSRSLVTGSTQQTFTHTVGTEYTVRARAFGTNLRVKLWPSSLLEPTAWPINVTEATFTDGYWGFTTAGGAAATPMNWSVDNVNAYNATTLVASDFTGTAAFTGAGTVVRTTQTPTPKATRAYSGAGTFTMPTRTPKPVRAVPYSGAGTFTATGVASEAPSGGFSQSGDGSLTATGAALASVSSTINTTGDGTLVMSNSAPAFSSTLTLSGSGTATVPATSSTSAATASPNGSGTVSFTPTAFTQQAVAANFSGAGTASIVGSRTSARSGEAVTRMSASSSQSTTRTDTATGTALVSATGVTTGTHVTQQASTTPVLATDDFNRPDDSTIGTDNWQGGATNFRIVNGVASTVATANSARLGIHRVALGSTDHEVSFDLDRGNSGSAGLILRVIDSNNFWGARTDSSGVLAIYTTINTSVNIVTSTAIPSSFRWPTTMTRMTFGVIGNDFYVKADGVTVMTYTGTAAQLDGTAVGMRIQPSTTRAQMDNFYARSLAPVGSMYSARMSASSTQRIAATGTSAFSGDGALTFAPVSSSSSSASMFGSGTLTTTSTITKNTRGTATVRPTATSTSATTHTIAYTATTRVVGTSTQATTHSATTTPATVIVSATYANVRIRATSGTATTHLYADSVWTTTRTTEQNNAYVRLEQPVPIVESVRVTTSSAITKLSGTALVASERTTAQAEARVITRATAVVRKITPTTSDGRVTVSMTSTTAARHVSRNAAGVVYVTGQSISELFQDSLGSGVAMMSGTSVQSSERITDDPSFVFLSATSETSSEDENYSSGEATVSMSASSTWVSTRETTQLAGVARMSAESISTGIRATRPAASIATAYVRADNVSGKLIETSGGTGTVIVRASRFGITIRRLTDQVPALVKVSAVGVTLRGHATRGTAALILSASRTGASTRNSFEIATTYLALEGFGKTSRITDSEVIVYVTATAVTYLDSRVWRDLELKLGQPLVRWSVGGWTLTPESADHRRRRGR